MAKCKFLDNGKCCVIGDSIFPTCASTMGCCMATIDNKFNECNWFTEV